MIFHKYRPFSLSITLSFIIACLTQISCKKMLSVPTPDTSISANNVYSNDATAISVLTGIYAQISSQRLTSGGVNSLSLLPSLSADELTLFGGSTNVTYGNYYINALNSSNLGYLDFWHTFYPYLFFANSAIEEISNSVSLSVPVKQQLLGEAKFVRAFCYYYLLSLYGDVPIVTGTDYTLNSVLPRSPKEQVLALVVSDLKEAQNLLSDTYLDATLLNPTTERVRPTKWVADALLARTYLLLKAYDSAEVQSTAIINNASLYSLDTLNGVFLKNSNEAIWQLQPVVTGWNSPDAQTLILPATGPDGYAWPAYLSNTLLNSFEPGDQRKADWIDSIAAGGITYYFPFKYKLNSLTSPVNEYEMVFRLGEQYLIRAESRLQQNNTSGSTSDLNIVRARAGLPNTTSSTKEDLMNSILHERQTELFTEWGSRWLDLKRTGSVDSVMNIISPQKGGIWTSTAQLYPIPLSEIQRDPNLTQNPGY